MADLIPLPSFNHTRGDSALTPCPECARLLFAHESARSRIVKARIEFPTFTAWVEIPLSEKDAHELRTRPTRAHTFFEQVIAPSLAGAISKRIEELEEGETVTP